MILIQPEEWFSILDQEEGEILALNILEEILKKTEETIFIKRVEKQLIPYAVSFAEKELLEAIRFYFFTGDALDESQFQPDIMPEPVPIDAWAKGRLQSVPLPVLKPSQSAGSAAYTIEELKSEVEELKMSRKSISKSSLISRTNSPDIRTRKISDLQKSPTKKSPVSKPLSSPAKKNKIK